MTDFLVCDPDRSFASSLVSRLNAWGYAAAVFGSGDQAVQKLLVEPCEVIVLGVYVGDLLGVRVIPEIYRVCPEARIIAVGDQSSLA